MSSRIVALCWLLSGCGESARTASADPPQPAPVAKPPTKAPPAPPLTLFENVRIFDGRRGQLSAARYVLVRGNSIERISDQPIELADDEKATIIDGGGRTLMPGLIDAHWHTMMAAVPMQVLMTSDIGYLNVLGAGEATATLMRGFTTVRDLGGPSFGLKRAIDEGVIAGPRIYPSGAMISVTGGHGDFRQPDELPRIAGHATSKTEVMGASMIADSPDEVRMRVREQLMLGAVHVKLTAGGGVASPHSPLDVTTFTEAELKAAVNAADNWGTYVTVHAYTPDSIKRSIAAGVKCIEHGHLMDEASAKLIAERGIWLSTQPFLDDEDAPPFPPDSPNRARWLEMVEGTDRAFGLVKKYKLKTAIGTDVLFSKELADRQGAQLAKLARWFTPAETLTMATATNGELLQLTGLRNPYPGKLGVVEEGALADLLVVDGDPLAHLELIADPAKNFVVIMKDGKVYKNTLRKAENEKSAVSRAP
jgi:imidazolonepropionase-like amidohydrolase